MEDFKEYFFDTWKSHFYGAWLGGSILSLYGFDWRALVVILPTLVLVTAFNRPCADQE